VSLLVPHLLGLPDSLALIHLLCVLQNNTKFTNGGFIAPANITTGRADVYIVNGHDTAVGAAAAAIQQFVSNGGGLVIGAHAWFWSYSNPVPQHPSNLVLLPMGIQLTGNVVIENYTFPLTP
jgi:hypothetical protein